MTTLETMAAVIAKLEAAPGPDRELDCKIALAVQHDYGRDWMSFREHWDQHGYLAAFVAHRPWLDAHTPKFTASFDAALLLILPGKDYEVRILGSGPDGETYTCAAYKWWPRAEYTKEWRCESGNKLSPAMALCIAALKVREAQAIEGAKVAEPHPLPA